MPVLGTWAENVVVNALLRGVDFSLPGQWWLALYLTNPTAADTGTEVSGSNYSRQPILFGAPSAGLVSNTTDISFSFAGTSWGTIGYAAIRSAETDGNLLFYGALVTPRIISPGDVLKFLIGNISCAVS